MYKKLTQAALVLALSMVLLWLSITYLLPISLPFALGAGLALLADPAVRLLRDRLRLPPALATAIGVTGVFCRKICFPTAAACFPVLLPGCRKWPRGC